MRCKSFLLILGCAGVAVLLHAAEAPAVPVTAAEAKAQAEAAKAAEAKAKAEAAKAAEAKAQAEAEAAAQANGAAYHDAKTSFDSLLKSNKLENAFKAAQAMLASAGKPGKGAWRGTAQTYDYLTSAFGEKKIFGRRQAIALYEEAIAKLTGDARAEMLLKYGYYLDAFALADEAEAMAYVERAFQVPDVTDAKKIALCKMAAQRENWATLEKWTEKAMHFAKGDVKVEAGIQQWKLSANIREQDAETMCAAYEQFFADGKYAAFIHGPGSPFLDYVGELSRRRQFAKALELLAKAPADLPPDTLRAYQKLTAEIHVKAAERFYDRPDPEDLKLAIQVYETIVADIPTNRPRDTIPYKVLIAELAYEAGDDQKACGMAGDVLELVGNPMAGESQRMLYLLGRTAYDAEDFAKAAEILEAAYEHIRGKQGNFPKRREMVETLVRSACAIGDYAKSAAYAEDLLALVKNHEKRRYQVYIDGLKTRVPAARP